MTGSNEAAGRLGWNRWRVARWTGMLALLLTPLLMMQVSDEWHWTAGTFLLAGLVLGGLGLLYELAERASRSRFYRTGIAVALVTGLLTVWTTIVRDDSNGIGPLMVVLAAAVASFSAWFRPAGMARAMLGVAVMHALLGLAVATAPSTARLPGGPADALLSSFLFAALWLLSAILFYAASLDRKPSAP